MIAVIPFARCHEARWHGTSASYKTDSLFVSANWGNTAIYTKYSIIVGVTLSTDLKFNIHLNINVAKSYQYLAFVRRNLTYCVEKLQRLSYISLWRSKLEYSSSVWDPHLHNDIHQLEIVQRRAARLIKPDYSHDSSVSQMFKYIDLSSLENRRKMKKLIRFRSYFHVLPNN